MTARVLRPVITFTTVTAVLIAALAVYAFLTAGTSHADSVYQPTTTSKYCNALPGTFPDAALAGVPGCAENLATSAAADYYTELDMPGTNLNFSSVVTFAPAGTTITAGTAITTGAKIGGLESLTNLGLANGPCNSALTVDFVFYNVALPDNPGTPRSSTNIAFPQAEGSTDRFGHWKVGSVAGVGDPAPGTPPRATGTSIAIVNYPSYLLDLFDPDFIPGVGDGAADPIVPKAVYGGLTQVAGNWVPLYFAQFEATGVNSLAGLPSPLGILDPDMGKPSVSVLNDPTAVAASPSTITDFCTPLNVKTMLLGTAIGSAARATNPATGGTQFVIQYNASLRDTDQDGWENDIDACPLNVDAGNPRTPASGDADSDGLPDSCDPNDATPLLDPNYNDTDADGFQNRQDNCPLVANAGAAQANAEELGAGAAADDGPHSDAIGSPCDSESGAITVIQNRSSGTWTISITLADATPNGRYHVVSNHIAKCFDSGPEVDVDVDGYCAAQDGGGESGGCAPSCAVRHTAWSGATHPMLQTDTDSDGFADTFETYMGTDPTKSCAATPVPPTTTGSANDETIDNWPLDFNDDRLASLTDVTTYSSRFGKAVDVPPATKRWDLTGDGLVSLPDVTKFSAPFGHRCGQGEGGFPGPFVQQ